MIDARILLSDLQRLLKRLQDDLRARIQELPELKSSLSAEWQAARDAARTAEAFESWLEQVITQAAVHWLLSCVFLRFIEDNGLVERPWFAGAGQRMSLARDRHEAYFHAHPLDSDRDYLLNAFREAGTLPGLETFFDPAHNPVFRLGVSGDAAMELRQFWQQVDPASGALRHDFADSEWNTRFLGDLYQDLSEAARKRYALLQTPEFVEEFILDRTLTPAIAEFGFREVRLIDPTCGSGHFLLGAFQRLVQEWQRHEPARNPRDIAQKALDAVAGVDVNPFAVAIARFRLLVAALKVSVIHRLADAPNFHLNIAIGDSLLHGPRFGQRGTVDAFVEQEHFQDTGLAHAYASEDLDAVQRILGRQYHVVVGNPPYIVVRDAALNAAYRKRYISCHMKYSLGCPFTERFFELALGEPGNPSAGFVGLITTNSFMKREFGSKLIEQVLPQLDLTHVIDTSGAYIPGHGTPTVILFGRHREPVGSTVRTVMGIKGEPSPPADPARGQVWSAILNQVDRAGSESEFVSVTDTPRATFAKHPWSIGGGGAADLKELIVENAVTVLEKLVADYQQTTQSGNRSVARSVKEMGFFGISGADEVMSAPESAFRRRHVEGDLIKPFVIGDEVRNWSLLPGESSILPYRDEQVVHLEKAPGMARWMWSCRTSLGNRATFGKSTYFQEGRPWWEWHQVSLRRAEGLTITLAEVATHNHFVLDRGGKAFKQTAPVIKLPASASEDEHLGLLGLLNSSVACFWLKQVCFPKGGDHVGTEGARVRKTLWDERYAFNSSNLEEFPVSSERPLALAKQLDTLARQRTGCLPASVLAREGELPDSTSLAGAHARADSLLGRMIALQEELDWQCYRLYGLLPENAAGEVECPDPPEVALGERAFEIVLARRIAAGKESTTWFERHGSTPVTEIPSHWPEAYRKVVELRIALIESDRNIGLIERPEYKRRWNVPQWSELEQAALRDWLLDLLESPRYWPREAEVPPQLTSTLRVSELARGDTDFMHVAQLYTGRSDFDVSALVAELVASESVPFLPVLRYTDSGLRKRVQWEATWDLQRREDAGESVGQIPVPPKYQSKDFRGNDLWRLRGALDVPKERWINYPGCERAADGALVVGWAGWDHLRQATAVAAYFLDMKDREGWPAERLKPLLAGLWELVPWLKQWHNERDARFGECMGDYYQGFVQDEARALGWTVEDLRQWRPAASPRRSRRAAS